MVVCTQPKCGLLFTQQCVHYLNILHKLFPRYISSCFSGHKFKIFRHFNFSMVLHPGATNVASFSSWIYHIICRILMTMRALSNDIKFLKAWVLPTKVLPINPGAGTPVRKWQWGEFWVYISIQSFEMPFINSFNGKNCSMMLKDHQWYRRRTIWHRWLCSHNLR